MKRNVWTQVVPAYAYALLIFVLGSLRLTAPVPQGLDFGDKYQHCVAFGLLEFPVYRALRFSKPMLTRGRVQLIAVVIASLLGAALEGRQSFIPYRSSELLDWIADTVGALVAAALVFKLAPKVRKAER